MKKKENNQICYLHANLHEGVQTKSKINETTKVQRQEDALERVWWILAKTN